MPNLKYYILKIHSTKKKYIYPFIKLTSTIINQIKTKIKYFNIYSLQKSLPSLKQK